MALVTLACIACASAALRPKHPLCAQALSLQALFAASGATYGSRRLRAALQRQGVAIIGRYKVRTLMRRNGLHARWKRKFTHTTDSKHQLPVAENVLNRQFQPEQANRAWVGDITYVHTASGWLYLAVVLDLFSRKVVGWAMASHMHRLWSVMPCAWPLVRASLNRAYLYTPTGVANTSAKHTLNY